MEEEEEPGGASPNSFTKGFQDIFTVSVYIQTCMLDICSWYCDNLFGSEERTVKLKKCYLTQHLLGGIFFLYIRFC